MQLPILCESLQSKAGNTTNEKKEEAVSDFLDTKEFKGIK
jgi:hypothetical protein